MLRFNVRLGERHVAIRHAKCRVTQKLLKRENISSGTKKFYSEGMSERVRRAARSLYTRRFSKPFQQLEQAGAGQRFAPLRVENRIVRIARLLSQVGP